MAGVCNNNCATAGPPSAVQMQNGNSACCNSVNGSSGIRLVVTDLDGTFFNDQHVPSSENVEAFVRCKKSGLKTMVATGRSRKSALSSIGRDNLAKMQYEGFPGVFLNGTVVYGEDGELIHEEFIPQETLKLILDAVATEGLMESTVIYSEGGVWCAAITEDTTRLEKVYGDGFPTVAPAEEGGLYSKQGSKVVIVSRSEVMVKFRAKVTSIEALQGKIHCVSSTPLTLEVMASTASKGDGLRRLVQRLGMTLEEVLAVGDGENDIEMLHMVGVAVAVDNASAEVKAAAQHITTNNNCHAFATVVEKFCGIPCLAE